MSTSSHSFLKPPHVPDVLGELLHSLSQPLTSLRCSLERLIDEEVEQRQESVAAALQQTERVTGMVQLMREYLDAERGEPETFSSAVAPVLQSVIEELASIVAVRGVRLRLGGTCTATMPIPESGLRLALQYLIGSTIEAQPAGGRVTLLLGEDSEDAVLRVEGGCGLRPLEQTATSLPTLHGVRITIARRTLETAGASLVFSGGAGGPNGFVLRIPRRVRRP
jgi:signal transduction histidine kinase